MVGAAHGGRVAAHASIGTATTVSACSGVGAASARATVISATVAPTAVPTSAVPTMAAAGEPSTTAVEASASATGVTTAVLGKGGRRKTDERDGCESCEKCFHQGGCAHCSLHLNGGLFAGRAKPLWLDRTLIWNPNPREKLYLIAETQVSS